MAAFVVAVGLGVPIDGQAVRSAPEPSTAGRLAFYSDRDGDTDIYAINADGSGETALTANSVEDRDPAWSPDGTQIAFISRRDGNVELYVMRADGSNLRRLTTNPGADFGAAWSPDGRRLAFVSTRNDNNSDIYLINADGTGFRRLTTHQADDWQPAWAPDGKRIAFLSGRDGVNNDGAGEIYVVDIETGRATRVVKDVRKVFWGAWSPRGGELALFVSAARKLEIAVVDVASRVEQNLSALAKAEHDTQPVWSPDGCCLAFLSSGVTGTTEAWVMGADGARRRRVSAEGMAVLGPVAWAPDGSALAFSGQRGGNWEVIVAPLDGGASRQLTRNSAMDLGVVWAPGSVRRDNTK